MRESRPNAIPALLLATLAAAAGALLARHLGVAGAAAAAAVPLVAAACRASAGAWLAAVPAAFAALPAREPPAPSAGLDPGPVRVQGVVQGRIRHEGVPRQTRFVVRGADGAVRVLAAGAVPVLPGDRVVVTGRLLARDGAAGAAPPLVEADPMAVRVRPGPPSAARLAEVVRARCQAALLRAVPGERGELLCLLVLGSGPPPPEAWLAAHRATGLSHLLVVSGAHVSLLALFLASLFRIVSGQRAEVSRRFRAVALAAILGYGAVAGFEPPVLRAVAALCLALLAAGRGRGVAWLQLLALPALLTALIAPQDLLGVSFCLSYAAVLGLALAEPAHPGRGWRRWLLAPLRASAWAMLLTAPFTLWTFGTLAPWTVLGTPLLGPLIALLLALGLCTCLVDIVAPILLLPLGPLLGGLVDLHVAAVEFLAAAPGAPVFALQRPPLPVLVASGVVAALLVGLWPGRRGVALAALAGIVPHFLPWPLPVPPAFQLLPVGHGQAALAAQAGGRSVAVDCGSLGDPARAAHALRDALLPRRRLDLLILTHQDLDHAGGVARLVQLVDVAEALMPAEMLDGPAGTHLRAAGTRLRGVRLGESLRAAAGIDVYRPATLLPTPNEASLWVDLDLGTVRVLVPGDAEEQGTRAFLRLWRGPRPDLLVLPHHGRENPAAGELLDRLLPRLALVSNRAGEGEPPQAAAARARGIPVLCTGDLGLLAVGAGQSPGVHLARPLPLR
ncbi:MAG: ComEC/Rec2 family competence protein [Planctomycetes bacterium]|nr:ComEC/Rec2 family competence protein [Planctomycetota bacterium]